MIEKEIKKDEFKGEFVFKGFWFDIIRGFSDICGWILIIFGIALLLSGEHIPFYALIGFIILLIFAILIFSDILKIDVFIKVKRTE